jgi:hypothetical protein
MEVGEDILKQEREAHREECARQSQAHGDRILTQDWERR